MDYESFRFFLQSKHDKSQSKGNYLSLVKGSTETSEMVINRVFHLEIYSLEQPVWSAACLGS